MTVGMTFDGPLSPFSHFLSDNPLLLLSRFVVSDSFATPWTVAHQTPVHGISQARYWNGLPFPSPGDLHNPGIKLASWHLQADTLLLIHHSYFGLIIVLNFYGCFDDRIMYA